ncbi:MGMT family protein [Irpex rosettiformis]|uniref:MGMT family protein n=1 Tax=Irpex rosettiformis TaxID=378272 RepID=A0ACB8TVF2_9APHY|nr:MGMT family protein [Irpex rosettiformis]
MDSAEFHAAVYHVVRQIPPQKVTSYGHVAKLIGMPRYSRHVGQALKFVAPDANIPWHRVLSSTGAISSRGPGTSGAQRQKEALEAEGVEVVVGRTGDFRVNFGEWGWFPEVGTVDTGTGVDEVPAEQEANDDNQE